MSELEAEHARVSATAQGEAHGAPDRDRQGLPAALGRDGRRAASRIPQVGRRQASSLLPPPTVPPPARILEVGEIRPPCLVDNRPPCHGDTARLAVLIERGQRAGVDHGGTARGGRQVRHRARQAPPTATGRRRNLRGWKDQLLAPVNPADTAVRLHGRARTPPTPPWSIDAMDLLYSGRFDGFCIVLQRQPTSPGWPRRLRGSQA